MPSMTPLARCAGALPVHAWQPDRCRDAGRVSASRPRVVEQARFPDCVRRMLLRALSRRGPAARRTVASRRERRQHRVRCAASCSTACRSARACRVCAQASSRETRNFSRLFGLYRTYHGCAVPVHTQLASMPAWADEAHVVENRRLYREKFERVTPIIGTALGQQLRIPAAAFTSGWKVDDDEAFHSRTLRRGSTSPILPGSYLARDTRRRAMRDSVRISLRGECRRLCHGGRADRGVARARA